VSADPDSFPATYASALNRHLRGEQPSAVDAAHELGRRAVEERLTLSELAIAYHEPLLPAIRAAPDTAAAEQAARSASRFFLASLTAVEEVRGEVPEITPAESRNASLLRQLSAFLADPSLAMSTADSLEEALMLVVEQAREIFGADCAQATVQRGDDRPLTAASLARGSRPWAGYLSDDLRPPGPESRPSGDWISAPITTLDGHQIGSIEVVEKIEGDFTGFDHAVLVHIAEMASAAIERIHLYDE
jgi:hypothetical protein